MHWVFSLFISTAYIVVCLGWGLLIVLAFARYRVNLVTDARLSGDISILVASSFLTGAGVVSALLTVLGLIGELRPLPLILVLLPGVVGLVFGRKQYLLWLDASRCLIRAYKAQPAWLALISGFTVILALGCGIGAWVLPPKGDAAAFYMVYPKIIAATGFLEPMPGPFYFFSAIGLPVELHYAALMSLADEHAAKFFIFPIAVSAGVMLVGIVRLCGGGATAITLAWAMLFSSYTFHHYIYDGKVDLAATAFGLAAVYWLLRGTRSRVSVWAFVVVGWFAGLATAAKFSYFLALGVSLSVLLTWQLAVNRPDGTKFGAAAIKVVRVGAVVAFAALIAWIPQLLKNAVLFDAPLAPFVGGQGNNWLNQVWFAPEVTQKILLTYPFALVFGRYPMQGGGLSFLFLAFLPFVFWLARPSSWRRSVTTVVTVAALAAVAIWMLLRPSVIAPRYILASLLMFVPILALAAEAVLSQSNSRGLLRAGVVVSAMMAIAASFWHLLPIPSAIISGMGNRDVSCILASPECASLRKLAEVGRPDERVMVASYYPYWLTSSQLQCRDTLEEQREIPEQGELLPWLLLHGFAYIAVDPTVSRKLAADLQQLAVSEAQDVQDLSGGQSLKLYRIKSDLPARVRCVESTPGRWHLKKDA